LFGKIKAIVSDLKNARGVTSMQYAIIGKQESREKRLVGLIAHDLVPLLSIDFVEDFF